MNSTVSIFFHNYYGQHREWINFFCEKLTMPFSLFYNIVGSSIYNLEDNYASLKELQDIKTQHLNKLIIRLSPNTGKDIGGKLVLMDAYLHLKQESEFIVFFHDKKSPHKVQNEEWQQRLFRILDPVFIQDALAFFKTNPRTGIVTAAANIQNEYVHPRQSFTSNNHFQLTKLKTEFGINITDYRYVAGTMFWARAAPLVAFFEKNSPLEIRRSLEPGNVMDEEEGTATHAWERILSWLIVNQGYSLKGA